MLAALGCDAMQGYYLSHALPAGALEQWLRDVARRVEGD